MSRRRPTRKVPHQGELTPLERGTHALRSGMDVKAYAATVGRARSTVHQEVYAAEVASAVPHMWNEIPDRTRHLAELHAAPSWLWAALVAQLITRAWSRLRNGAGAPTVFARTRAHAEPPLAV
jgi:hypothetical protein